MIIDLGGKHKQTPLHSACSASSESAVILIQAEAKVDASDDEGNRPLHIAALNDQPKSIAALLEAGANINSQNKQGTDNITSILD